MNTVKELITYRIETERYRERKKFIPVLTDFGKLPVIYSMIKELVEEHNVNSYFYLLSVILYSPKVFQVETMNNGLRKELSDITGVTGSYISRELKKLYKWMELYYDFADEVDMIYQELLSKLNK